MYEGIMLRGGLGKLDPVLVAREQGRGESQCSTRRRTAADVISSCSRWVPGMLLAAFRKGCCRKSPLAERFGMSSLGELGVIGLYYLFNILLTVLGGTFPSLGDSSLFEY